MLYQHAAAERDKVIAAALSDLAGGTVTPITHAKSTRKGKEDTAETRRARHGVEHPARALDHPPELPGGQPDVIIPHPGRAGRAPGKLTAILAGALATWATRDDSTAQPEVRASANTAMAVIDAMLADLHAARSALVGEIRASDDATDARIDAMLAVPLDQRLAAREAEIRAAGGAG